MCSGSLIKKRVLFFIKGSLEEHSPSKKKKERAKEVDKKKYTSMLQTSKNLPLLMHSVRSRFRTLNLAIFNGSEAMP